MLVLHLRDTGADAVPELLCVIQIAGSLSQMWSFQHSCLQLVHVVPLLVVRL